jgi:hypothetical protein
MFIRSKVVKGQTYYQLVEAFREAGRPRQRTLASLGTHPTIEAARGAALERYRASKDEGDRALALERANWLDGLARRWHAEKGTAYQQDPALVAAQRAETQRRRRREARERWERYQAAEQERAQREAEERERARREAEQQFWAEWNNRFGAAASRPQASPGIEQDLRRLGLWPTKAQIQEAFRRKAHECHPDHGGSDAAMVELTAARDRLLSLVEPAPHRL